MSNVVIPVGNPAAAAAFTYREPTVGDVAVSTGFAIAGIGTTAMGALVMTQTGMQIPLVLTPIAKSSNR